MGSAAASLYEADFVRWTEQQARALRDLARAGANLPVDWENVAEEIESLGRSDRRELESRLTTSLAHLLKLQFSPASVPRAGWRETIVRERADVELLLRDSPSLRRELPRIIAERLPAAVSQAAAGLAEHGELETTIAAGLRAATWSVDDVLNGALPDMPAGPVEAT